MNQYKHLAWPIYLTGSVIIFFPALEFVLTIWPLSPGILSWRFGAVGLLARSLLTPLVGLALIFAVAVFLEHVWVQRVVSGLGFAGSAILLMVTALFALDLLQFRNQVRAEASTAYDVSSGVALMKLLAVSIVLLVFGVSGRRVARRAAAKEPRRPTPAALVVKPRKAEADDSEDKHGPAPPAL